MASPSTPAEASPAPLLVGVVVFDGVMQMDFIGPTMYLEQLPRFGVPATFTTISHSSGALRSSSYIETGMPLFASAGFRELQSQKIDILVIPGGIGRVQMQQDAEFLAFIRQKAEQATFVLTVCTGSAILADTGFLDGRRATTNKIAFNKVAPKYPKVQWARKARWVVDGNVWTSSGVTAGMDMGYAFIAAVYGQSVADDMATYLEVSHHPSSAEDDPFAVEGIMGSS